MKSSVKKHMQIRHPELFEETNNVPKASQQRSLDSDGCICPVCGQLFDSPKRLNRHMYTHKKEGGFQCSECLQQFESDYLLRLHKLKPRLCKKAGNIIQIEKLSQCVIVNNMANAEMKKALLDFKIVDESHVSGKPYQCGVCHKRFKKVKFLNLHIQCMHLEECAKSCLCSICGRGFPTRGRLEVHYRTHTSARPYRCRICHKSYRQLGHIKEHLKAHGKGLYTCKYCQKTFRARGTFSMHLMTHCTIFPFKCPVVSCQEKFRDISTLCQHGATCFTESEPPIVFICKFCYESYEQSDELIAHLQVHENDGLFPCEVCNEKLSSFRNLYLHKEKHGHFLESELESQASNCMNKTFNPSLERRKVAPVDWNCSVEDLLNQYDFIKESSMEPSESDEPGLSQGSAPSVSCTGVVEETCGNEAEELILIAEQLTNMGTVSEPYTDVVITDQTVHQMNNFDATFDDSHIVDLNPKNTTENQGYSSVVMKTTEAYKTSVCDKEDHLLKKNEVEKLELNLIGSVKKETDVAFADMSLCKEQQIFTEIIYSTEEPSGDQNSETKHLRAKEDRSTFRDNVDKEINEILTNTHKPQNSNLCNSDCSNEAKTTPSKEEKNELETKDTSNTVHTSEVDLSPDYVLVKQNELKEEICNDIHVDITKEDSTDLSQILNNPNFNNLSVDMHSSCPIKVVDTEGNEVTVCVVNERGEQEQLLDSQEILKTVLQTGRYKIQCNFKQIDAADDFPLEDEPPLVVDLNKGMAVLGSSKKIKVTNVFVVSENNDCESSESVKSNANKQSAGRKVNKVGKAVNCVKNTNKFKGEAMEYTDANESNETDKVNYSVRLHYYQEKDEKTNPHICQICGSKYKSVKALNHHKKTHLPDEQRKYRCTVCGKGFNIPNSLTIHMRTHSGDKPFSCDICDKKFRQLGHLQVHMRIHFQYYPFKCGTCDRRFPTNSSLKTHMKRHNRTENVGTYLQCKHCKAQFIQLNELKIHHFKVHVSKKAQKEFSNMCNTSDEKNGNSEATGKELLLEQGTQGARKGMIICDVCGYLCRSRYSAKLHRQRHETGSDFQCSLCDKALPTELLLKEHKRLAHAEPTPCEVCGSQFKSRITLRSHLLKVHKIGVFNYQCKGCCKKFIRHLDFLRHVASCLKHDFDKLLSDI